MIIHKKIFILLTIGSINSRIGINITKDEIMIMRHQMETFYSIFVSYVDNYYHIKICISLILRFHCQVKEVNGFMVLKHDEYNCWR